MLKITKSTEPLTVSTIVACIYGPPGVGKTSLASSADTPLLLDFDAGSYRSQFRKDVVQINSWNDIEQMDSEDLSGYKTIVIDTIGRALDLLSADIIKVNPKMGYNGSLNLQGYGQLKGRFTQWIKYVRSFGLDVIIVAHSTEVQAGEITTERIDAQGSSKNEIYKSADLMGRLVFENGKRVLNFNPTDTAFGKNPVQIPAREVPSLESAPNHLATIMTETKSGLTRMDAQNSEVRDTIEQWRGLIGNCTTADHFNQLYPAAKETNNKVISAMMAAAAKKQGLRFSKPLSIFEAA